MLLFSTDFEDTANNLTGESELIKMSLLPRYARLWEKIQGGKVI